MRRRNSPEGIWQPRPIPGLHERVPEVLDDLGIPWCVVSKDTPAVRRAHAWAASMKALPAVIRGAAWRGVEGHGWRAALIDEKWSYRKSIGELGPWILRESPFVDDDIFSLQESLRFVRSGRWIAFSVSSEGSQLGFGKVFGNKDALGVIGVGLVPRRSPPDPSSVWSDLSPWPTWWRADDRVEDTGWNGDFLRIALTRERAKYLSCTLIPHEAAHWLLCDPDRRSDPEFMAALYNPPKWIKGLKSIREEAAAVVLEAAIADAIGCEDKDANGWLSVSQVSTYVAVAKLGDKARQVDVDGLDVDRIKFGVFDAAIGLLKSREAEFPFWLRRRIAVAVDRFLAGFGGCGLPTSADLRRYDLSREYARIGGRVQ